MERAVVGSRYGLVLAGVAGGAEADGSERKGYGPEAGHRPIGMRLEGLGNGERFDGCGGRGRGRHARRWSYGKAGVAGQDEEEGERRACSDCPRETDAALHQCFPTIDYQSKSLRTRLFFTPELQ